MRPGATLPELILVAWLFALVLAAAARFAGAQSRLVALTHDRARAAEATRIPRTILGGELRALAAADISALAADSIRIRAVRGGGAICAVDGSSVLVRYRGVRLPEPEKDSVLLIGSEAPDGVPVAVRGAAVDEACGGTVRLGLEVAPEVRGGWALVFETGAYHVGDGALRYRRGAGGRQPMTETLFDGGGFEDLGPVGMELDLRLSADALPRLEATPVRTRFRLLNREMP